MEENYEQELKKKYIRLVLNAAYGSVACIAFANSISDSPWCATKQKMNEAQCIKYFYDVIGDQKSSPATT